MGVDMSEERLFTRLLFLVIALLACLMPVQNDTWWHLRAGEVMLESRRILLTDIFSHTVSGQPLAKLRVAIRRSF